MLYREENVFLQMLNLLAHFGLLINLESLEIRENSIKKLPPSLMHLTRLEKLDIGDNKILELPSDIGSLSSLKEEL